MRPRLFVVATTLIVALLAAGVVLAAPSIVSTFTVTPSAAPVGTAVTFEGQYDAANTATAFCFYFASADAAAWNTNFTALNSVAGVVFAKGAGTCPAVTGYGNFYFYTNDTSAAIFGDIFSGPVIVPNIATGTKLIAVRQYSGTDCDGGDAASTPGGVNCTPLENFRSTSLVVQTAPTTVYVGSEAAVCAGYSPCYITIADAVNAVAVGGTIRVLDEVPSVGQSINKDMTILDHTGGGGLSNTGINGVLTIDGATVVIRDLTLTGNNTDPVLEVINSGSLTVKGCTILNGSYAFSPNSGSITAYANNISDYAAAGVESLGGIINARHNWWSGAASIGDADAETYRLGADVEAWGEGALGGATISGGTGTGVIVSHGRGDANAPFGKATLADGNTQCSDYYDFFTAPGASGTWNVLIPIDAGTGCDSVYNNRQIVVFAIDGAGAPDLTCSPDTACWNSTSAVNSNPKVQMGRNVGIRWAATTTQLGGTPIVAANQDGNDPTALTLRDLSAQSRSFNWTLVLMVAALVAAMTASGLILRRRSVKA